MSILQRNNIALLIIFLLHKNNIESQNLIGKWIPVVSETTYFIPEFPIFDISKNEFKTYNLDTLYSSDKNFDLRKYEEKVVWLGENSFQLQILDNQLDSENITHVRLLPTRMNIPFDSLLNGQYQTFYKKSFKNGNPSLIKFNTNLGDKRVIQIIGVLGHEEYLLKYFHGTLFILHKIGKKLRRIVPVEEVCQEYIKVYGHKINTNSEKLYKIKEIEIPYLKFQE